jgi:FAD/FMN-containing dehydrogenase
MHTSTKRSATIGGFVADGPGGVGSVTWGGLREPGNAPAARIVTMEAEPRIIELREAEAQASRRRPAWFQASCRSAGNRLASPYGIHSGLMETSLMLHLRGPGAERPDDRLPQRPAGV